MANKNTLRGICLVVLLSLGACGPTLKTSAKFKPDELGKVALLPPIYPPTLARETIDYAHRTTISELQNAGYVVLDERITDSICKTSQCPNRSKLSQNFEVNGFFTLQIDSISTNNFLAGFFNKISGEIRLSDVDSIELLKVSHIETERGGLIFNTGQVLEGISSTFDNASADNKNQRLAEKFIHSMVEKLPTPPASVANQTSTAVKVENVVLRELGPFREELCLTSVPGSLASLLINRQKANLRETTPGNYCGIFRLDDSGETQNKLEVEVISPWGEAARQYVERKVSHPCDLKGIVKLNSKNGKNELLLSCNEDNSNDCMQRISDCRMQKVYVYRSDKEIGPFEKSAELMNTRWEDNKSRGEKKMVFYQVIAVDRNGEWSLPVALASENDSNEK